MLHTMKKIIFYSLLVYLFLSCSGNNEQPKDTTKIQVQAFIDSYTKQYLKLVYAAEKAAWASNIKIVAGDTIATYNERMASEAIAKFTGSKKNIDVVSGFLKKSNELNLTQVKQLKSILFKAANNPATVPELVSKRIIAEASQNERLYGFDFKLNGKSITTNQIDEILKTELNIIKREQAWEASKEVGKNLKNGLINLRSLRNKTVQALGYNDYFTYQVSNYGMNVKEMIEINDKLIDDVWPLYRELHTYMRYQLAGKYNKKVPNMLPAHWLPNRWGQDWSSTMEVKGINLDGILKEKGSEWLVKQAERFYVSLGFDTLPASFYEKSSLYPVPEGQNYKKNNHASAWHLDLNNDVRSLMSVIPNAKWYETTHHELGHIYYYISYTNEDVPPLLREGANRAFHEAVGSMMGLAAMQKPFLTHLELIDKDVKTNDTQLLLKEALNYITFIPWSAGVMTRFEKEIYADNLPDSVFNKKWWELKRKYQGIIPPTERGEEYCDATSKTHINNDAAQYYDYALSYALLFQIHNHIATNILKQDPRATNYYGNKKIGNFLRKILYPGASQDWRDLLKETTGQELNAKAMLNYFAPLMEYLKEINKGRKYTLSEKPI